MTESMDPDVYYYGLAGFLEFIVDTVKHPIEFTRNAMLTGASPLVLATAYRELREREVNYDTRFPAQLVGASIGLASLVYTIPLGIKLISRFYEQPRENLELGIAAIVIPTLTNLISATSELIRSRRLEQARYEEERKHRLEEDRLREEEGMRKKREEILRDRGHRMIRNGKDKKGKEKPKPPGLTRTTVGGKEVIMKDGIPVEEKSPDYDTKPES